MLAVKGQPSSLVLAPRPVHRLVEVHRRSQRATPLHLDLVLAREARAALMLRESEEAQACEQLGSPAAARCRPWRPLLPQSLTSAACALQGAAV